MPLSSGEERNLGIEIRASLDLHWKKLTDTFDAVLTNNFTLGPGVDSTNFLIQYFSSFRAIDDLLVSVAKKLGVEKYSENDADTIISMVFKIIGDDFPWFIGVAEVIQDVEEVRLAIRLEGNTSDDKDDIYRERMWRLYRENQSRTPKEVWISSIDKHLAPDAGLEDDSVIVKQFAIYDAFKMVVDKFFDE